MFLREAAGYRDDITRFFVALARAAGFDASIVRISNRMNKFFDKGLLSERQLDTEIAVVDLAGKSVYLDPGTKFCSLRLPSLDSYFNPGTQAG